MRLKPEVARQIVGFIRGGAYPMVAAEASGVPRAIFKAWLKRGENPRAGRAYREFAREVQQAAAQARLIQERAVYEKEPRFWLSHGPGRESQDFPGWSSEVKPVEAVTGPVVELSRHPDWR